MNWIKKVLLSSFTSELNQIYSNKDIACKTINNFYISFLKFQFFLKLLICFYLITALFVNLFFIILFFFKFKINYFEIVHKIFSKLPFFKNIQNFLISNLLLHTEQ